MPAYVIDCGHGGHHDALRSTALGGVGPRGTREKDVTWAVGRRVAELLGPEALLTRRGDQNPSLGERLALAERTGARVLLSLHADVRPAGQRGPEAWVHERAAGASEALAQDLSRALGRYGAVRRGPLALLTPERLGRTAACLVDLDALSDPEGERLLADPGHQEALAQALARALARYGGGVARGLELLSGGELRLTCAATERHGDRFTVSGAPGSTVRVRLAGTAEASGCGDHRVMYLGIQHELTGHRMTSDQGPHPAVRLPAGTRTPFALHFNLTAGQDYRAVFWMSPCGSDTHCTIDVGYNTEAQGGATGLEDTCAGWERDCQSFAIVAARHFRTDCLGNQTTASPQTVECASSGTSGLVHWSDDIHVEVSWTPGTRVVRCTQRVYPGGSRDIRDAIYGWWAEYTYDCEPSGRVRFTQRAGGDRFCIADSSPPSVRP